jgi:hypothetical protein
MFWNIWCFVMFTFCDIWRLMTAFVVWHEHFAIIRFGTKMFNNIDVLWQFRCVIWCCVAAPNHLFLCPNKFSGASQPDQLVYKNVIWNKNAYRCVCLMCYLNYSCLWCVSVWFTSTQDLGLWIYSKIWAGHVGQRQAKPAAWEALGSDPIHVTKGQRWASLIFFESSYR